MKRSLSQSHHNSESSAVANDDDSDPADYDDDAPPRLLQIRSKTNETGQLVILGAGDSLRLADVQRWFPDVTKLLLKKGDKETTREATDGIFKAPKKGWDPYVVYAVLDSSRISDGTSTSSAALDSSNSNGSRLPNVSDILRRFNVSSFDQLRASFRFAASGSCDMKKFIEYRTRGMHVFVKLMLKLGPDTFDMSTLFRISEGDPKIVQALMFLVQEHRKCELCDVEFQGAANALMHFASIEHGQKCMANFQEPQLLDDILLNARDMGFFRSTSNLPDSENRFVDPPIYEVDIAHVDSVDEDDSEELDSSKESSEAESEVSEGEAESASLPSGSAPVRPPKYCCQESVPSNIAPPTVDSAGSVAFASPSEPASAYVAKVEHQPPVKPPSLFGHFKVAYISDLLRLPTFRCPVELAEFSAYSSFRRFCTTNLIPFLTTIQDRNAPIMYYLYQAHQSTTMLHDINNDYPKQCSCKVALTMKHVFDIEHIKLHPHTINNELWTVVNHVSKKANRSGEPNRDERNNEPTLHRIFKVDSKDELFKLEQFSKNIFATNNEFNVFRDQIYDIIINSKDSRLNWLSPGCFSIDKLVFIRDNLKFDSFLSKELNYHRCRCSECGEEYSNIDYYEHLLKELHLNETAFEQLAFAMKRLQPANNSYTTFTKPDGISTAVVKERLTYLKGFDDLSKRQRDEKHALEREMEKRNHLSSTSRYRR
uniref:C2H2-type domain-containing protein n=1 Tax=Panagrellus redivivus TaxID=6233 RepID=A0A7E4UTN0_PANRE